MVFRSEDKKKDEPKVIEEYKEISKDNKKIVTLKQLKGVSIESILEEGGRNHCHMFQGYRSCKRRKIFVLY